MFVALDLPEPGRSRLAEWRDQVIEGRSELRPVRAEALHVTLVFLGWQNESAAERIAAATFASVAGMGAPLLRAAAVKAVPPRRPRLLALDLDDEGDRCVALQASVSGALEAERVYRPEKRPFWPHVTLARVKRGARAEALGDVGLPDEAFEVAELTLYRSTLRPQGAVYDPLARTRVGES
jgi:RNA 2',3'-cyclic 3'-phosphodiesterase